MTRFAVVDIETTGHTPKSGDQIIEIGIVIIENKAIVNKYSTYVNPDKKIPIFITNLTGITDEEVRLAPSFKEIANEVLTLCKDAYFVAHHVQFDLGFLNEALVQIGFPPIREKIIDTVELARIFSPKATGFKLSQLAEYYGIEHKHPHRALSDAYVTAELLIKLLDKAKHLPMETLEMLDKLEPKLQSDLHDIFQSLISAKRYSIEENKDIEMFYGIALKRISDNVNVEEQVVQSFGEYLEALCAEEGELSKYIEGYEPRTQQIEMSEHIYSSLTEQKHLIIEAETGTGKTLAYLIPSIYHALKTGERVVISTYTTQLQEQTLNKEIPVLQKALSNPFESIVIKGKSHYLSLKKFHEKITESIDFDNYDVILTKALILVWLTETETGDVDELQLPSSGYIFWRKINAEAEGVIDPTSPWSSKTFYQRIRSKADKAQIIITNHALLCTDMAANNQVLPAYDYCIIDEAHHFEKTASQHFGSKLSYVSIQRILNDLKDLGPLIGSEESLNDAKEKADYLFRFIFTLVNQNLKQESTYNDVGRTQAPFELEKFDESTRTQLKDLKDRFQFKLIDILDCLHQTDNEDNEDVLRSIKLLEELIDNLKLFLSTDTENLIKWCEIEAQGAKNAVYLNCEPIDVGSMLSNQFYQHKKSVILTSATLTIMGSFQFILEKNGLLNDLVDTIKIPSPFSLRDQVQLLVPNDLPNIKFDKEEDYVTAISYAIYELAKITKGRMLILFTSYQMLKKTYEMLIHFADQDDFVFIAQGISSGSRERLKKNFQSFEQAILLGTASFWEGIDIPGSDLSAIVIVRLPFEPPNHPVYSKKSKLLKQQGKNPFMELALPQAVIRFKQGFGRLIRSKNDSGIVFVCDGRIIQSQYGHYFIDSISEVPVYYDETTVLLDRANDWFS